jgi:hypothetical protein
MRLSHGSRSHYVYAHFHPVTKQVVYVGQGTGARAWVCDRTQWRRNSGETVGKAHAAWIENLLTAGYTPADFVHIERKLRSAIPDVCLG